MDLHPERHFDGLLAQLSIYSRSLYPDEVEALYGDVMQHKPAGEISRFVARGEESSGGSVSGSSPDSGTACQPRVSGSEEMFSATTTGGASGDSEEKLSESSAIFRGSCSPSEVCVPAARTAPSAQGRCLELPRGLEPLVLSWDNASEAPLRRSSAAFPLPSAWFALGGERAFEAWPPSPRQPTAQSEELSHRCCDLIRPCASSTCFDSADTEA
jgi:hypothetical protein